MTVRELESDRVTPEPRALSSRREAMRYARGAFGHLVSQHPGLLLTLAYFGLTTVGLMYDFWFFLYFKIAIATYAEPSDFLLAAVRSPLAVILAILPLPLLWLITTASEWLRKRSRRYDSFNARAEKGMFGTPKMYLFMWPFFVLTYAFLFTQLYAASRARAIKAGHGTEVRIELSNGQNTGERDALLLGTTSRFVFLYYPAERRTHIIPLDNVAQLIVRSSRRDSVR
jgi:hypothetical protein